MNIRNKTESAIFVALMCSLLSEDLHSEGILTSFSIKYVNLTHKYFLTKYQTTAVVSINTSRDTTSNSAFLLLKKSYRNKFAI